VCVLFSEKKKHSLFPYRVPTASFSQCNTVLIASNELDFFYYLNLTRLISLNLPLRPRVAASSYFCSHSRLWHITSYMTPATLILAVSEIIIFYYLLLTANEFVPGGSGTTIT
jgi:hypothetical protein